MAGNVQTFTCHGIPARYRGVLPQITLAYETYGQLNAAGDNAVLVVHGFSSNAHVASHHAGDSSGWWEWAVGPGRPLDTDRFFVVCANNLGSCFGSSGPAMVDETTGHPFAYRFPSPSIADIVATQRQLQDWLGIDRWHTVIGGSLGGMAALQWCAAYPAAVRQAVCLNAGVKVSFVGQGLLALQTEIIGLAGDSGLDLARRLATLSFLAEEYFRNEQRLNAGWRLERFLAQEAEGFAARFNRHSYLAFLETMRSFALQPPGVPRPGEAAARLFLVGCAEDSLFPSSVIADTEGFFKEHRQVHCQSVTSAFGHDAFLMDERLYAPIISAIIEGGR